MAQYHRCRIPPVRALLEVRPLSALLCKNIKADLHDIQAHPAGGDLLPDGEDGVGRRLLLLKVGGRWHPTQTATEKWSVFHRVPTPLRVYSVRKCSNTTQMSDASIAELLLAALALLP